MGNSWSPVAMMNFPHGRTAAVGVINDKIYVAGGMGTGMKQRELEVFDPADQYLDESCPDVVWREIIAPAA